MLLKESSWPNSEETCIDHDISMPLNNVALEQVKIRVIVQHKALRVLRVHCCVHSKETLFLTAHDGTKPSERSRSLRDAESRDPLKKHLAEQSSLRSCHIVRRNEASYSKPFTMLHQKVNNGETRRIFFELLPFLAHASHMCCTHNGNNSSFVWLMILMAILNWKVHAVSCSHGRCQMMTVLWHDKSTENATVLHIWNVSRGSAAHLCCTMQHRRCVEREWCLRVAVMKRLRAMYWSRWLMTGSIAPGQPSKASSPKSFSVESMSD